MLRAVGDLTGGLGSLGARELPNIKGEITSTSNYAILPTSSYNYSSNGALSISNKQGKNLWLMQAQFQSTDGSGNMNFNAADSSSIYKDNGVVAMDNLVVEMFSQTH